jgi:hypothetical protein
MPVDRPRPAALTALLVVLLLQGVGAVGGGVALVVSPGGGVIKLPLSYLDGSPFHDYLVPGIVLLVVLGVGPLVAAWALIRRPPSASLERLNPFRHEYWGWTAAGVIGVGLLIWIAVEAVIIPYNFLQPLYAVVGAAILVLTLMPSVRAYYRQ